MRVYSRVEQLNILYNYENFPLFSFWKFEIYMSNLGFILYGGKAFIIYVIKYYTLDLYVANEQLCHDVLRKIMEFWKN